jgi:hypothetical protein
MALLTLAQQQPIKAVSPNWAAAAKVTGGVTNYVQTEIEVEENELKDLLGVALLQDLQTNPTTALNIALLDGASFTDCNNNTVNMKGLRYVIAFMVHAQQVVESKYADTFTGYVNKNRNETNNVEQGERKKIQARSKEIALQEFELIKQYLNENSADYPLWIKAESKKAYTPKYKAVKRTLL